MRDIRATIHNYRPVDLQHLSFLIGGIAVMLFGTARLKDALQRLTGQRLKAFIATLSQNRMSALAVGAGSTFVFQSSGVTTSILVGFATSGLVQLEQAMAVLLGANIGTTFTVQILAFKATDLALWFVTLGYLIDRISRRSRIRALGGVILGFGFIFYGIGLMGTSTEGLRHHPWFMQALAAFADNPLLGVAVGAVATALFQSSAATLAVIIPFCDAGQLSLQAAVPLVLGANIGTCSMAFIAAIGEGPAAKRVAWAHILMKIASVALVLPFLSPFEEAVRLTGGSAGRQAANLHTYFNLATAVVFMPMLPIGRRLLEWMLPEKSDPTKFGPRYLDPHALENPSLAFGQVTLEIHRMAEITDTMLRDCIVPFHREDPDLLDDIEDRDQRLDILEREVKLYLAKIHGAGMSEEEAQYALDLFATATNLEEVGDIITKNVCSLGRKRLVTGGTFTLAGMAEIAALHQSVCHNFQLVLSAFTLKDRALAARVIREKRKLRSVEEQLRSSHFERLHTGNPDSVATTGIHVDLISALLRANSAFSRIAYRIAREESVRADEE